MRFTGSFSGSRLRILSTAQDHDFDTAAFREIPKDSELRASVGFVPMVPGGDYVVAGGRQAGMILKATRTTDAETVRRLVDAWAGDDRLSKKQRAKLKLEAEASVLPETSVRMSASQWVVDDDVIYVGATSDTAVGMVAEAFDRAGIKVERMTSGAEPGQGSEFLGSLGADEFDPVQLVNEGGWARLETEETLVTTTGQVLLDFGQKRYERAAVLAAKISVGALEFKLNAERWTISGLPLKIDRCDTWQEALDAKTDVIAHAFDELDRAFEGWQSDGAVAEVVGSLLGEEEPRTLEDLELWGDSDDSPEGRIELLGWLGYHVPGAARWDTGTWDDVTTWADAAYRRDRGDLGNDGNPVAVPVFPSVLRPPKGVFGRIKAAAHESPGTSDVDITNACRQFSVDLAIEALVTAGEMDIGGDGVLKVSRPDLVAPLEHLMAIVDRLGAREIGPSVEHVTA